MMLSALYPRYRDISPIWDVVLQILFYASPVLYVLSTVPDEYERAFLANPIAVVLTQMRHALIDPSAPSAAEAIGPDCRLLMPLGTWWRCSCSGCGSSSARRRGSRRTCDPRPARA